MAFETIQSLDCDTTTALGGVNRKNNKKNPTSVEGYYLGSREFDSPKSKTGKAWLHVFQTKTGTVGVYGKTDLDRKIFQAPKGAMTRVTQSGMQQTKNGEMYKFKVEIDKDNAIEVSANLSDNTARADTEVEDDVPNSFSGDNAEDDIDAVGTEDDFDEPLDETPPARAAAPKKAAAAPDAARRVQVQALLSKGRSKTA